MSKAKDREALYERIAVSGLEHLSDEELITGILGRRAKIELREIATLGVGGLIEKGLTALQATALASAVELGVRINSRPLPRGSRIQSSRDVDAAFRPRLAHAPTEQFIAIPLDSKNRPLGEMKVGVGGIATCPVSPSDVFRSLIYWGAAAAVFVHNHPSGEPTPSADDVALTERLRRAGEIIGIRVLDHVIVGQEGYFSFLDAGLLGPKEST